VLAGVQPAIDTLVKVPTDIEVLFTPADVDDVLAMDRIDRSVLPYEVDVGATSLT
jgi:hypothetical protein